MGIEIPGPLGQPAHRRRLSRLRRGLIPLVALLGEPAARAFDAGLALAVLGVLAPLWLGRALVSRVQAGRVLAREPLTGRYRVPFERLTFAGRGPLRSGAVWLNVLRGDLSLVGPRPLPAAEADAVPVADWVRFAVRPGLVSTWALRRRIGIAHEAESALDRELVYARGLRRDLGLAARALAAGALGGGDGPREMPPVLNLFGIPVVNTDMAEAVDWILAAARGGEPRGLAFVNPDCLNIAWGNRAYRDFLRRADRVLPDGIGIHLACRMMGVALRANVNGTDLFPRLCAAAGTAGVSLYLLGARPGIARAAGEAMVARWPGLVIAGTRDGYFTRDEEGAVIADVNASGAGVLLVAFGAPRQELWIDANRGRLAPRVCLGVGGLFDFYSGRISRAPVWVRELGLEWVWRLVQEPGRMWRRYLVGNPLFLFRVWRQIQDPGRFPLPGAGAPGAAP